MSDYTMLPFHPVPFRFCNSVGFQACFEGNPFKTVPGPFKLFWQCMQSKPGYEYLPSML